MSPRKSIRGYRPSRFGFWEDEESREEILSERQEAKAQNIRMYRQLVDCDQILFEVASAASARKETEEKDLTEMLV
jgi:Lon protease-like protein